MEAVEKNLASLPPGCHIHLQRKTLEQIPRSLRRLVEHNWRRLRAEVRAYAALRARNNIRLSDLLREQAIELDEVYRGSGRSRWTSLKGDAGLLTTPTGGEEE